jgi:hypothetical protein
VAASHYLVDSGYFGLLRRSRVHHTPKPKPVGAAVFLAGRLANGHADFRLGVEEGATAHCLARALPVARSHFPYVPSHIGHAVRAVPHGEAAYLNRRQVSRTRAVEPTIIWLVSPRPNSAVGTSRSITACTGCSIGIPLFTSLNYPGRAPCVIVTS